VTDHDRGRTTSQIVLAAVQHASQQGRDAKDRKVVPGDHAATWLLARGAGRSVDSKVDALRTTHGRQAGDEGRLRQQALIGGEVVQVGARIAVESHAADARCVAEHDQFVRRADVQLPQQHRVHQAEDRRIGPDA